MNNDSNLLARIWDAFLPALALFGGTCMVLLIIHFFGPLIPPLAIVATIAVFLVEE